MLTACDVNNEGNTINSGFFLKFGAIQYNGKSSYFNKDIQNNFMSFMICLVIFFKKYLKPGYSIHMYGFI